MAGQNRAFSRQIKLSAIVVLCAAAPAVHAQWLNYKIPGIPRTADGKVNLTAPTPRTPDGKPDLGGNLARDLKAGELQMLPWAEAQVKENQTNLHKNDPMVACLPPGVPRVNLGGSRGMPHPFKVVQTPSLVVLLYETSTNQTFRQVFLDGRPLPSEPQPSWLGYSVGRWEGDTLVVESNNFHGVDPNNPRAVGLPDTYLGAGWLDHGGSPYTEAMKLTERFRRVNYGLLDIELTVDDPKAYTRPFTVRVLQEIVADGSEPIEFICHENQTFLKLTGRALR
jgi:hypothetical protein